MGTIWGAKWSLLWRTWRSNRDRLLNASIERQRKDTGRSGLLSGGQTSLFRMMATLADTSAACNPSSWPISPSRFPSTSAPGLIPREPIKSIIVQRRASAREDMHQGLNGRGHRALVADARELLEREPDAIHESRDDQSRAKR
jgi:hypothetical protein